MIFLMWVNLISQLNIIKKETKNSSTNNFLNMSQFNESIKWYWEKKRKIVRLTIFF